MGPMMLKRSSVSRRRRKPVSELIFEPWKSIMMDRSKLGRRTFFWAATISEHLTSSRSGDFGQSYHMVTKISVFFCSVPLHNVEL